MTHQPPAPPTDGGAHGEEPDPPHLPPSPFPPPAVTGPPQGPAEQAPNRRTGVVIAIVAAVIVLLCSGCLIGGFLLVNSRLDDVRASPSPSAPPPAKGGCVRSIDDLTIASVKCGDRASTGEVLETFAPDRGDDAAVQSCPAQSDRMVEQDDQIICLRSTDSSHVGSPGMGGGIIVPGDCVTIEDSTSSSPAEVPCTKPAFDGKVLARVNTSTECAAPAVRYGKLETPRQPVVCLATGPGFAGPGQCIHTEGPMVKDFAAVSCAGAAATMKVLALKPTDTGCPDGTTNYIEDDHGLLRTRVLCLAELKRGASS